MSHSSISFPGWIAKDWKRERAELLKELIDECSFGRSNDNDLKTCGFQFTYALAQLRKIFSADRSAKMADENSHCILAINGLFKRNIFIRILGFQNIIHYYPAFRIYF